jgi:hypothetical protein
VKSALSIWDFCCIFFVSHIFSYGRITFHSSIFQTSALWSYQHRYWTLLNQLKTTKKLYESLVSTLQWRWCHISFHTTTHMEYTSLHLTGKRTKKESDCRLLKNTGPTKFSCIHIVNKLVTVYLWMCEIPKKFNSNFALKSDFTDFQSICYVYPLSTEKVHYQ